MNDSPPAWHHKYRDGCVKCGRTDRVHVSGGRCSTCYNEERNARINQEIDSGGIWYPGYPDGCAQCGRTDRKHVSGGRCSTCYTQSYRGGSAVAQAGATNEAARIDEPTITGALSPSALGQLSTPTLMATYRDIIGTLRDRGVVRTGNAPTGDYAEYLAHRLLGGILAPNSEKSFDITGADGLRYQVKSRVVDGTVGKRSLSAFRSWDFDFAFIVLFNSDYSILRAVSVPRDLMQDKAIQIEHVNAGIVNASDVFLALCEDRTVELRAVVDSLSDRTPM